MGAEVEKLVAGDLAALVRELASTYAGHNKRHRATIAALAVAAERVERERGEAVRNMNAHHETSCRIAAYRDRLEDEVEALRKALEEIDGCFNAALVEGWRDALENGDIERIRDIWNRRLGVAQAIASVPIEAEESTDHPAEQDAHELTKALTGLVGGGSEMFVRKRGRYLADIPYCVERIRDRLQRAERRALDAELRAKALRDDLAGEQTLHAQAADELAEWKFRATSQAEARSEQPEPWSAIPPAKRFGRRLTADAVALLKAGTLLRFYSEDPWFEPGERSPTNGEIVRFTGAVNNDFPRVGQHLEVATLDGETYPGGGWVYRMFQFVGDAR